MTTVELHMAFLWTCDDCGRDNFVRGVTVAPEAIDPDELPGDVAEWLDAGGDGGWMSAPDRVTCEHCRATFDTEQP
jgi:hypothetical protein